MKQLILFLLSILILVSCAKNEVDNSLLVYEMKSIEPDNYMLNIKNKGAIINFQYKRTLDTVRKLDFKYSKENNILVLGLDTLKTIHSVFKPRNTEFKMYQNKQKANHATTYVFNENHGLFARLSFESHQLFLKDSITPLEKENIFKGLFLELNKTFIE